MNAKALRVGLVGPLPPPFGGMANQTRQLAELLAGEGVVVSLVQTNAPYRPAWVGRIPFLRAGFRLLPFLFALWRLAGRSNVMHVMANSGWSWHLFAAPALWVARLRGVPAVVNYRGGEAEAFLMRSAGAVRRSIGRGALLAVPSGFLQAVFARFGMAAEVVPNIVDLERFSNPAPGRRERRHLLVARNLEAIYDNATAIRAFALVHARHPDATLTIAGSGPEEAALRGLTAELRIAEAVSFTGRLAPDAMAERYRQADVAINPSRVDNMPNSLLEAMAVGLPVVSTQVGGVPFLVKDEVTALLVPPGNPEAMAAAILRLLGEPELADRLAANGLEEVQRYSWLRVWPAWQRAYRRAAGSLGEGWAKENA